MNAGAALERADREELLRERSEELRTRASQMEFVNSIIRHDVYNGMTVIRSRASFLADDLEGRNREFAETIIEWADNITGLVDRVRTVLTTLSEEGAADLEVVDAVEVVEAELERIERSYSDVTFERDLPRTAPVRADDVLGDVVQNLVTNAVDYNDRSNLVVTVSIDLMSDHVVLRVADNGTGIPPDYTDDLFGRGNAAGGSPDSGFGLFFVAAMVDAYGGDVENDDGAVFVVSLPVARTETALDGPEGR